LTYVQDIRDEFIRLHAAGQFITDKTGVKTLEIVGATFVANEPTIFGVPNEEYIKREIDWYRSMSMNVYDMDGDPPKIWKQAADENGNVNSNYGYLLWHEDNHRQYDRVYTELAYKPNSRRAVAIYTRPSMWHDYHKNGRNDFVCTNTVQYLVRDDAVHAVVQMRSNDVVYGYRNDYAWQSYVLNLLAIDLGLPIGVIHWQVGSLHVYERDFWMIDCWRTYGRNMTKTEYVDAELPL
jgi:thymidylate synthase